MEQKLRSGESTDVVRGLTRGLTLWLVPILATRARGFSPDTPVFRSPKNRNVPKFQFDPDINIKKGIYFKYSKNRRLGLMIGISSYRR